MAAPDSAGARVDESPFFRDQAPGRCLQGSGRLRPTPTARLLQADTQVGIEVLIGQVAQIILYKILNLAVTLLAQALQRLF